MEHSTVIRPATAADQATIRRMVRQARLPPFSLAWPHFLIAERDGQIIGIGQVRDHRGIPELGSLAVLPPYRGQGIGGQLIAALEARAGLPLYLFCRAELEPYYGRFGYRRIPFRETPGPLRLKTGFSLVLPGLFGVQIIRMCKDRPASS